MKDNSYAMKLWHLISKPFQIAKILEILYMLDWLWYAALSYIPARYINSLLFDGLHKIISGMGVSLLLTLVALIHMVALYKNIVWLRKFNLLFNITLLLYLTSYVLLTFPISAGIGYYIILISVSIFAFWRMDESH